MSFSLPSSHLENSHHFLSKFHSCRQKKSLLPKYKQLFADLLHCTNEPNVSIPTLANLLIERTQNPSWVVVYKALITTHHLMCYGNEVTMSVC